MGEIFKIIVFQYICLNNTFPMSPKSLLHVNYGQRFKPISTIPSILREISQLINNCEIIF